MLTREQKEAQLRMSFEEKIQRTKELILEWYLQYGGNVYVSFSGGKDSTALLHLARSIKGCENITGVFFDTGLEFPEIREFVKKQENIIWVKPDLTFKQVLEKYGYPVISKEQAQYINEAKHTKSEKLRGIRLGTGIGHIANKWRDLIDAEFEVSHKCCLAMKKRPAASFEKKTGMKRIVGTMASESKLRLQRYFNGNCNAFSSKHPMSKPLSFWNEQDVLRYLSENNIEISGIYGKIEKDAEGKYYTTGRDRTGCMFCMFGVHLEGNPNRFEKMKDTHPVQYEYIMNKLNGKHVLDVYLACAKGKTKECKNG